MSEQPPGFEHVLAAITAPGVETGADYLSPEVSREPFPFVRVELVDLDVLAALYAAESDSTAEPYTFNQLYNEADTETLNAWRRGYLNPWRGQERAL